MNNLPKHRGAGPAEARGPMQLHHLHRLKAGPERQTVLQFQLKTIIQKRLVFQCCNDCSLFFHLLILTLFLNLFAFSALVSPIQFFTSKHYLKFSGLLVCSVTLPRNQFLFLKNCG